MNSYEFFLARVHYSYLNVAVGFVSIVALGSLIRSWNRGSISIFLILLGFYLCEVLALFIGSEITPEIGNFWFYNVIQIPELGITLVYFVNKVPYYKRRRYYWIAYFIFLNYHLITLSFITGWNELDLYAITIMTAIVGIVALDYLYHQVIDLSINPLEEPAVWFAFATVIFNLASIPIVSLFSVIQSSYNASFNTFWSINDFIYSLWYIISAIGLLWINRQKMFSLLL